MGSQGLGAQDFFLGHFPIIKATALASQEDTSGAGEPVAKRARKPSAKQLALERPSVRMERMESVAATDLGRRAGEPVAKRARKPSAKQLALERPSVRMERLESVAATDLGRRLAERKRLFKQQ